MAPWNGVLYVCIHEGSWWHGIANSKIYLLICLSTDVSSIKTLGLGSDLDSAVPATVPASSALSRPQTSMSGSEQSEDIHSLGMFSCNLTSVPCIFSTNAVIKFANHVMVN